MRKGSGLSRVHADDRVTAYFGMLRSQSHAACSDLLVDHHKHPYTSFSCPLEYSVESILLILGRRPTEIELWTEPPITDPDGRPCFFEDLAERPKIVYGVQTNAFSA